MMNDQVYLNFCQLVVTVLRYLLILPCFISNSFEHKCSFTAITVIFNFHEKQSFSFLPFTFVDNDR